MLSISQFSKIAQVSTKTLRYYDEIELLKPNMINPDNGYRYYQSAQLSQVLFIRQLKTYGCSLEEIKKVLEGSLDLLALMVDKKQQMNEKMARYAVASESLDQMIQELTQGGTIMMSVNYPVSITKEEEKNLLFVRKTINVTETGDLFNELFEKIETQSYTPIGAPMTFYHSPEFTPEHYDVEVAVPVVEKNEGIRILKAGKCATLTFEGNYQHLSEAYVYLQQWLEAKALTLNGSPYEVYLTDPSTADPNQNQVLVCFPISE